MSSQLSPCCPSFITRQQANISAMTQCPKKRSSPTPISHAAPCPHYTLSLPISVLAFHTELALFNRFHASEETKTRERQMPSGEGICTIFIFYVVKFFFCCSDVNMHHIVQKPFPAEQGPLYLARGHSGLERRGTPCRCPNPAWVDSSPGRDW